MMMRRGRGKRRRELVLVACDNASKLANSQSAHDTLPIVCSYQALRAGALQRGGAWRSGQVSLLSLWPQPPILSNGVMDCCEGLCNRRAHPCTLLDLRPKGIPNHLTRMVGATPIRIHTSLVAWGEPHASEPWCFARSVAFSAFPNVSWSSQGVRRSSPAAGKRIPLRDVSTPCVGGCSNCCL
jgi:hypothetical protein